MFIYTYNTILLYTILHLFPLISSLTPRGLALRTLSSSNPYNLDDIGMSKMSPSDRGKYKAIVSEVGRRKGQVEKVWGRYLKGGLRGGNKRWLEPFFNIAVTEVVFMGVEPYVAGGEGMKRHIRDKIKFNRTA